jgi:hypothetical protein
VDARSNKRLHGELALTPTLSQGEREKERNLFLEPISCLLLDSPLSPWERVGVRVCTCCIKIEIAT